MEKTEPEFVEKRVDNLVRLAVLCTITGMLLVLLFLIAGFQSWSVGLGVFLGMPVMMLGILLYVVAVIRDLRHRKVLEGDSFNRADNRGNDRLP